MHVLTIALAIAIPFGIAALTTWINITIKFAPDAAHARREAALTFMTVIAWIANGGVLVLLIWEIISPNPNLRVSLLVIIMNSFGLFNFYMLMLYLQLRHSIARQGEYSGRIDQRLTDLAKLVGKLIEINEKRFEPRH